MATTTSHNKKSSAVKRILSEARELEADGSDEYEARPLETNIFEWHFTLRGPSGTEFEQGLYHGRILLPVEYPFRPPDLMLLTPNGRWECNKKICLTFTGYHESMWQPAWGIRTALLGVQGFMSARAEAAQGVASVDYPIEERRRLATKSRDWSCSDCAKSNHELLPDADPHKGRKKEQLPDGLIVDASGAGKGQEGETVQGEAGATAGGLAAQATQSQAQAASSSDQGAHSGAAATSLLAGISSGGTHASGLSSNNDEDDNDDHLGLPAPPPLSHVNMSSTTGTEDHSGSNVPSTPPIADATSRDQSSQSSNQKFQPRASSASRSPHDLSRTSTVSTSQATNDQAARVEADAGEGVDPDAQFAQPLPRNLRRGVPAEDLPAPRRPTRSEARVAQLDRAILTVVLLLCGLVVRRLI